MPISQNTGNPGKQDNTSHSPLGPVDSKGAAIDEILYNHFAFAEDNSPKMLEAIAQAKQAILAILAQEVNKARIDEVYRFKGVTFEAVDNPANLLMQDYAKDRINQLERLG